MTLPAAPVRPPDDHAVPATPAADGPACAASAAGSQRLAHLFRDALQTGTVHPLQALIERYRAGERG